MFSLLRIYATCALIPGEDIKNKCVPFPVFVRVYDAEVLTKLIVVFTLRVKNNQSLLRAIFHCVRAFI